MISLTRKDRSSTDRQVVCDHGSAHSRKPRALKPRDEKRGREPKKEKQYFFAFSPLASLVKRVVISVSLNTLQERDITDRLLYKLRRLIQTLQFRKRTPFGREKGDRNWSWPFTRIEFVWELSKTGLWEGGSK